ncbi:hypothetical protein [Jeotgalicoccus sp. WY2]|uniref:hypothetical protein n=1 Tax=Jeotgalicoccus sp. WY2 TaxID=2708346 RepID=UPI001BD2E795|nr:hypothetical protein [Jeotgalicoccus sp. WY2]
MEEADKEYFEQATLKDQALRTLEVLIKATPEMNLMLTTMTKNGMEENAAMLSVMEFMEKQFKKK